MYIIIGVQSKHVMTCFYYVNGAEHLTYVAETCYTASARKKFEKTLANDGCFMYTDIACLNCDEAGGY